MRDAFRISLAGFVSSMLCVGLVHAQTAPVAPSSGAVPAPAAAPAPVAPAPVGPAPAAVPPSYGPAPGEPPPGYGYPPGWRPQGPPNEIRYIEGRAIPAGYHLETRPRKGLIVAGSIVFGVPYLFSISVAASSRTKADQWLFAPVVGPFADLAGRKNDCDPNYLAGGSSSTLTCSDESGTRFLLMTDGIMQVAGATMFILGLALPQHLLVRDDAPYSRASNSQFAWSVAPTKIGRAGYGLGVVGAF